jgi:hypothetical protein
VLRKRLAKALSYSAMGLAVQNHRIYGKSDIINTCPSLYFNHTRIRVYLDFTDMGSVGVPTGTISDVAKAFKNAPQVTR